MRTFSLISSLDPDFQASVSLSGFEKIYYNYGDSYKDIQDELQALLDANNRYKWDSAHEMGHKVLDEYGEGSSPDYSWTHKRNIYSYAKKNNTEGMLCLREVM